MEPSAVNDIISAHPEIKSWILAGHSMGGLTASGYAIFAEKILETAQGVAVEYVSCEPSEGMKELFLEQYGEEYEVPEDEETEQV